MEVDILKDGSLDLPEDYLNDLDVVVVSVHSNMHMPAIRMTDRVISALAHPAVDILGHPTGRLINRREPYAIDLEEVFKAAIEFDVAIEINAQPDRLDINDVWARRACELGVRLVINTDAHSADTLRFMQYGVDQARRGWVAKTNVLNTSSLATLGKWLTRRSRRRSRVAVASHAH
jgi:DNA polymerase (family 10)